MKIIYLHQYFKFPDETGGTRSYDLASSFIRGGYDVSVVTATSNRKYNTQQRWVVIEKDGIKVNYIYLPYGNHLSYIQRSFVFFKFLWFSSFRLLKIKADVVLATSTPLTIGIPALLKKWFGKTPFVFEVRDVWPEAVIAVGAIKSKFLQRILYAIEKLIYANASAIVPLSSDMQHSIVSRYPKFRDKTQIVIENISEINRFQNLNENKIDLEKIVGFIPRFSILYAGTFGKVNGIDYVIRLAKKTINLDKQLIYILMGSGNEKAKVIELASMEGVLNQNVFILAPVKKRELPAWYKGVSMGSSFVIDVPELWANSANKFFDTLAAQRPILINHKGWQAERILKDNIGYVLPEVVTESAAKKFVEYTKDTAAYQTQCARALDVGKQRYSLEVAVEKYLGIFKSIKNDVS